MLEKRRRVTKEINRNAISTHPQAIQKSAEPAFIEPMQCKPVTSLPAGEKWTFEIKFDGYRCVAAKRGTEVTLFRAARRYSLNRRFPNMVDILASCPLIAGGKGRSESARRDGRFAS